MDGIYRIENPIMTYAWGSRSAIAELLGEVVPSPAPQAELWMGAHPRAPSTALLGDRRVPLPELIATDAVAMLGAEVAVRFQRQLPFLFKVLAAAEPLSIQAHPSAAQARAGFDREEAAGVPRDSAERCYRDPSHKPELLCALTPFSALCGFRPLPQIAGLCGRLDLRGFEDVLAPLRGGGDPLRGLVRRLLTLPRARQAELAQAAAAGARPLVAEDVAFSWVARLAAHYPEDSGVLAPLFLNPIALQPGQAVFLGPGQLHAYLEGTGLEIMASSDNVLRGGLTPKHVDVDELCAVLDGEARAPRLVTPAPDRNGAQVYPAPAAEFRLARIALAAGRPYASPERGSVEILLCTEGQGEIEPSGQTAQSFRRCQSLLVPAAAGTYRMRGEGTLYRADVPVGSVAE